MRFSNILHQRIGEGEDENHWGPKPEGTAPQERVTKALSYDSSPSVRFSTASLSADRFKALPVLSVFFSLRPICVRY